MDNQAIKHRESSMQAECHISNIEQVLENLSRVHERLAEAIENLEHKVELISLDSGALINAPKPLENDVPLPVIPIFFSRTLTIISETEMLIDNLNAVIRGIKL